MHQLVSTNEFFDAAECMCADAPCLGVLEEHTQRIISDSNRASVTIRSNQIKGHQLSAASCSNFVHDSRWQFRAYVRLAPSCPHVPFVHLRCRCRAVVDFSMAASASNSASVSCTTWLTSIAQLAAVFAFALAIKTACRSSSRSTCVVSGALGSCGISSSCVRSTADGKPKRTLLLQDQIPFFCNYTDSDDL